MLIQLPKFDYSSLDFETIISDVQNLILEHPEYLENWDDFLETNAGRMLLEMNAFVMEKFTSKLDWIAREMFIGTATQRQSQINILQLINYKPTLPSAAHVKLHLKLAKWYPSFSLPNRYSVTARDIQGNNSNFELLEMADDGKPNYDFVYTVNTGTTDNRIREIYNVPFYQGVTRVERDIFMDGVSNERYTLSSNPVIKNSIRVFSETTGKEYIEVDSFISPEAQQEDVSDSLKTIPYMVKIDAINNAQIIFGHSNIVDIPEKDEKLRIIYRVGGGSQTNIVKGAINVTKTLSVDGNRITMVVSNPDKGFGGYDSESIEEAKLTAPLTLRSANKTVTNEDYVIHLEELNSVRKAKIVSKENEPQDIFTEYGHFLPPLDTWIYIIPEVENIDEIYPLDYNRQLQITKPYIDNGYVDYEDFEFNAVEQTVYLKKLRNYQYYAKHVVLFEDTPEAANGVTTSTFEEITDFTLDYTRSEISRVQGSDGGNIPAGNRTLRIFYLKNDTVTEFASKCFRTFASGRIILSDNAAVPLYPSVPIIVTDKKMQTIYSVGEDYEINYNTNTISIVPSGELNDGDTVLVTYADYWDAEGDSEENQILNSIKNKKMLCVDNHVKDSVYTTFDLVATVYCYKNLKGTVQIELPEILKNSFNILNASYDYPISKAEIISTSMNHKGVRFMEIDYLGKDYVAYRRYIQDEITLEELNSMDANKVEHKITPKYNEILVLNWDEYDGANSVENQRHGLILNFVEA